MPHDNPIMFCHDSTTIFYPTGPGRVHMIAIAALADSDGSDEHISKSTKICDLHKMLYFALNLKGIDTGTALSYYIPDTWPKSYLEVDGELSSEPDGETTTDDFRDALEQWADWCDRDSARLDSLDEVKGRIERAA
jgi:hypothetical protein